MIFSRYINRIAAGTLTAALAAMLWGCATEDFDPMRVTTTDQNDPETQLVLRLAVPGAADTGTRSVESRPTDDELEVKSLRLLIFPSEDGNKAQAVVNTPLMIPSKMAVVGDEENEGSTLTYTFKGFEQEKDYLIYVAGNIPHNVLSGVVTLEELKKVKLDYTSTLPIPGELPMFVAESCDNTFRIEKSATGPTPKELNLEFACVKMQLNLIFDKTYEVENEGTTVGTTYGDNGFKPTAITLSNVTETTPLLHKGNELLAPAGSRTQSLRDKGGFYTDWTDTGKNNDKDDRITPGTAAGEGFTGYADNWLWQYTFYIPERYTRTGDQLELKLEGKLTDKDGKELTASVLFDPVKIGVTDTDDNVAVTDLPRGSYYEVIGHIASRNLDRGELEIYVKPGEWITVRDEFEF